MKKICYVVTLPLTIRAFFIPQLKYLVDNGFDVTVICSNDDNLQEELGEEVRYLSVDMPRGISISGSITAVRKLIKIFRKEKFDLVQYSTPNAALYTSIASKAVGVKVRNYHLMGYRYLGAKGFSRNILKMIEKITCALSTNIECVSSSNLELGIKEKLFKQNKATVVWNGSTGGIDLTRFDISKRKTWRAQIRRELGYSETDFLFGFVGRITRDKGVNELLEAFLNLKSDSKLLLVGNKEGANTLNQILLKKAAQCSNIRFVESVADIERYYAALDVLVLPSYREGFGNVIIEAAAVGTPAIVTNIPGPIDAVGINVTALTVKVKDSKDLYEKMFKLENSPNICKTMSLNCRKYVKSRFDDVILCEYILKRKQEMLK